MKPSLTLLALLMLQHNAKEPWKQVMSPCSLSVADNDNDVELTIPRHNDADQLLSFLQADTGVSEFTTFDGEDGFHASAIIKNPTC